MKTFIKAAVIGLSIWQFLPVSDVSENPRVRRAAADELREVAQENRAPDVTILEDTSQDDGNDGGEVLTAEADFEIQNDTSDANDSPDQKGMATPKIAPEAVSIESDPKNMLLTWNRKEVRTDDRDKQPHKKIPGAEAEVKSNIPTESTNPEVVNAESMRNREQPIDGANDAKHVSPEPMKKPAQQQPDPNKPHMIIHIGPSKTGTSTMQRESSNFYATVLAEDRYFYVGKFGDTKYRRPAKIPMLFNADECFHEAADNWKNNKTSSFAGTPCWKERVAGIEAHRRKNQSLILSDEAYSYSSNYKKGAMDSDFFEMVGVAYQDWNVLVVPVYRRYFDWILSVAKEGNRKKCHPPSVNWNGKACANLWAKVNMLRKRSTFEGSTYSNLDTTLPAWRNSGFPISILNFHSEKHLTCQFYCDVVPDAPNACNFCMKQPTTKQNAQEVSMTAYNDIVYEAARRGIIDSETTRSRSRHDMTLDLTHYHGTTLGRSLADLPLLCPRQPALEELLNKSLTFEQMVYPELFHSPQGEEEHRKLFWQAANKEKQFCKVDVDTLLNGKSTWQQVLDSLKNTTSWPEKHFKKSNNFD